MLIDEDEEELLELDADTVLWTSLRPVGEVGGGHLGTGDEALLYPLPKWETLVEVVIGVVGRGEGVEVDENGRVRARA